MLVWLQPYRSSMRFKSARKKISTQAFAGKSGGRIYLAAYALHLGATGLTFFDDDVINFFSPHATDKSAIFLLAIGKPLKRKPR